MTTADAVTVAHRIRRILSERDLLPCAVERLIHHPRPDVELLAGALRDLARRAEALAERLEGRMT